MLNCVSASAEAPDIEASIERIQYPNLSITVAGFVVNIDFLELELSIKEKNSLFESGSSKKLSLTGLCDVWGWVTTYWAAADAAPSPNRLHPIKTQLQNEDRNVNPAIG